MALYLIEATVLPKLYLQESPHLDLAIFPLQIPPEARGQLATLTQCDSRQLATFEMIEAQITGQALLLTLTVE